jgi:alkanesulfonate monooxygenase SsuD/methylene tetrahydromethanopterin reductase-like flavin-dependent oxidoreductase (luciferase family)
MLRGDADAIAEQIRRYAEVGIEHVVLEFLVDDGAQLDQQMSLFAERVRPQIA